ncbi:hypothetical protein PR003_g15249 [Phytophthora rubi]|uniref:Uncharacterized protein n=1 Tax=Phytophthora rubi TaxID=129364 RepID=A0A6A4F170_9STRA|nr:hypothetical protein PR001_g28487 [Phytophthora rubi]KAE9330734.1 hypothetical protein PR003_g15249 [Phytophthora rubi]
MFAQEELAGEHDEATTESWLKERAGKSLRRRWGALEEAERGELIRNNPDEKFPVGGAPSGVLDGRKDPRNYTKRGRGVETPTELSEESAPVDNTTYLPVAASNRIAPGGDCDKMTGELLSKRAALCKDVISAALFAEVTSMAEAVRDGDSERVALRAAAVVDCMAARVSHLMESGAPGDVVEIIRDIGGYMAATRTQLKLHSNEEARDAVRSARAAVEDSNAALQAFTDDVLDKNEKFQEIFDTMRTYRATTSKFLGNIGHITCTSTFVRVDSGSGKNASGSDADSEYDHVSVSESNASDDVKTACNVSIGEHSEEDTSSSANEISGFADQVRERSPATSFPTVQIPHTGNEKRKRSERRSSSCKRRCDVPDGDGISEAAVVRDSNDNATKKTLRSCVRKLKDQHYYFG